VKRLSPPVLYYKSNLPMMSKNKKAETQTNEPAVEDFLPLIEALINNYERAMSLSDAGDDALSTPEIMEILMEINPFITVNSVVTTLQDKGFNYQFDLKDRQFKWLIKYKPMVY